MSSILNATHCESQRAAISHKNLEKWKTVLLITDSHRQLASGNKSHRTPFFQGTPFGGNNFPKYFPIFLIKETHIPYALFCGKPSERDPVIAKWLCKYLLPEQGHNSFCCLRIIAMLFYTSWRLLIICHWLSWSRLQKKCPLSTPIP